MEEKETALDTLARLARVAIFAKGKTQTQFADELGISRIVINQFLNRHIDLRPHTARKMAEMLGLNEILEKI